MPTFDELCIKFDILNASLLLNLPGFATDDIDVTYFVLACVIITSLTPAFVSICLYHLVNLFLVHTISIAVRRHQCFQSTHVSQQLCACYLPLVAFAVRSVLRKLKIAQQQFVS